MAKIANGFMQLTGTLFYKAIWHKIESVQDSFHQPRRLQALASMVDMGIREKYDYWAKQID